MTIRIRVDDYPHTKGEPQHTIDAFRDFHRRLTDGIGGRRYLLGVIPGRCTPEHLLCLRRDTDCVIGMHGTDHDERRLDRNGGNQFEPYLTAAGVGSILQEHREALELAMARPVRIYMPPRNVIDRRTVGVLEGCGFEWFTTGPETDPEIRRLRGTIHSQPPHEYGRSDEMLMRNSHVELNLRPDSQDTVLTLHWTWEVNIGLQHLDRFLAEIPKDRFGDFDG